MIVIASDRQFIPKAAGKKECLPKANADLFDQVQARKGFTALDYYLNERMFFGLYWRWTMASR